MENRRYSLRPNIYFHIKYWMIKKLNLSGSILIAFAYIFDCSCNQTKVEEEDLINVMGVSDRTARRLLKRLFDKGLVQRKKKRPEIASKYVYWIDVDKVYKQVFKNKS